MKTNKLLLVFSLVLTVFFLSQFAAEFYFLFGPKPESGKKFIEPAFDFKTFSLSSHLHTETAFSWLEAGTISASEPIVKKSMALLLKALHRNPLDYQARYYLAKAYLQFSALDNDYFYLGVRELKRAARIRGSNKQIALDCAKVFSHFGLSLRTETKRLPPTCWPQSCRR